MSNEFNLEDFLSKLITYIEFVQVDLEKWQNSRRAIFDIIREATNYEYDASMFKHGSILNILSRKLKKENKLNVVTTNYDTMLEDAAESLKYTVFDGFSFSQTPQFDDDMFEWHLSKHVSNVKTHENVYKQQVINLLKLHGSLTWEKSQNGKNIVRKSKDHVQNPVMIFPSANKYMQSYQEPYFELFSRFQEMLKRPNTLLLTTGFSFSDNHIARMILQAIKHNEGLYCLITDFDIEPKDNENWQELIQLMDDAYEIAFLQGTLNGNLTDMLG